MICLHVFFFLVAIFASAPSSEITDQAVQSNPEHARLSAMTGTWDVDLTFWLRPGGPGVTSKGVSTIQPLFGGLFIEEKIEGTVNGTPFTTPPIFLAEGRTWVMVKAKPRQNEDPKAEYPFAIAGESFIPAALASLRSGDSTQVCLMAYNFPSNATAITYAGRAMGVDGKAHGKVELKLVKASDQEHVGERKLLLQVRPSGLDPGRYALAVKLLDPQTGKSVESSVPFDVF